MVGHENAITLILAVLCLGFATAAPQDRNPQQVKATDIKGEVPTDGEIDLLLSDPNAVSVIVECLLANRFDDAKCDSRLKRAHQMAEEFFRSNQRCSKCTKEEEKQVDTFLKKMQQRHPREHRKLTEGFLARAIGVSDYDYDYYYDEKAA